MAWYPIALVVQEDSAGSPQGPPQVISLGWSTMDYALDRAATAGIICPGFKVHTPRVGTVPGDELHGASSDDVAVLIDVVVPAERLDGAATMLTSMAARWIAERQSQED